MTIPNFKSNEDWEGKNDKETISYDALIRIITELCDRIEQLEKDIELLKSYAWEV